MRIFARGYITAMVVALFIIVIYEDLSADISDDLIMAGFICGAVSQVIKQCKNEGE